jgi:hypothetical protein
MGQSVANAAWMEFDDFHRTYPSFQLADELILQGGRDVMTEIQYQWHQLVDELILQGGRDVMTGIQYQWHGKKGKATAPP